MIILLFTGQARTSPFAHNAVHNSDEIMNSYTNYIFTDDFKSKYKYKIYISTDDIHLSNTINYFGANNVQNIHLLNTDYYLNPIKKKLKPVNFFIHRYNKMWKSKPYQNYKDSIHQHYKIFDAYNLLLNDNDVLQQSTLICRIRLDIVINVNILELINKFTNPKCEILCHWDLFAIGRMGIMECYFSILIKNGFYTNRMKMPKNSIIPNYETSLYDKWRWTYAPEIQLFKMLCHFCIQNKFDIMDAMKPVVENIVNDLECINSKEIKILR